MDPSDVRRQWTDRTGAYSPRYYAHHGPDKRSEWVRTHLDRTVGTDARVLEVGCSSGRHLAHLHDHGYDRLTGVELNPDAVAVMDERFPELADTATVHVESIEAMIEQVPDDAFDAVVSVETLQHIHPESTWVFDEIARVAADTVLTVENEGHDHPDRVDPGQTDVDDVVLYFRDWRSIFEDRGFDAVASDRGTRTTRRLFRASE